jgi:ABC-type antimicrobial peptide transport system permease subunit
MGVMGVMLAMVGLYSLVSYAAARRTREIGIRMAIGALPGSVLRMVLHHGLLLAAGGIALGLAGSVAVRSLIRATVPSTRGGDPGSYLLVVSALLAITLGAAYIPARRAARIDPITALRTE